MTKKFGRNIIKLSMTLRGNVVSATWADRRRPINSSPPIAEPAAAIAGNGRPSSRQKWSNFSEADLVNVAGLIEWEKYLLQ
jgi:hypothetical protein